MTPKNTCFFYLLNRTSCRSFSLSMNNPPQLAHSKSRSWPDHMLLVCVFFFKLLLIGKPLRECVCLGTYKILCRLIFLGAHFWSEKKTDEICSQKERKKEVKASFGWWIVQSHFRLDSRVVLVVVEVCLT